MTSKQTILEVIKQNALTTNQIYQTLRIGGNLLSYNYVQKNLTELKNEGKIYRQPKTGLYYPANPATNETQLLQTATRQSVALKGLLKLHDSSQNSLREWMKANEVDPIVLAKTYWISKILLDIMSYSHRYSNYEHGLNEEDDLELTGDIFTAAILNFIRNNEMIQ